MSASNSSVDHSIPSIFPQPELQPKKRAIKRKKKSKFGNEKLEKFLTRFDLNLMLKKLKRKNRFNFKVNKDEIRTKVENSENLEFFKNDTIPYEESLKRELTNLPFQLLIVLTASYSYFAYLGYFKFSFFCLALTIYLYNLHLESRFQSRLLYCSQLIQEKPERQVAFFNRMNASQLVKLDSNEQLDERSKWLNDLLFIFWPYINCLLQKEVDRQGFSRNGVNIGYNNIIYFENFTLGDRPPVISSISVNKQGCRNDELVIDMKILYSGNCLLSFSKQTLLFFRMNAGVKDIYFRCNARLFLRPLIDCSPYFGGYSFHLLDKPIIDYEGINFANLADNQLFKNYLVNQIAARIMIPNYVYFNMLDDEEVIRKIKQPIPIGLCFLQIIEAENLPMIDQKRFFLSGNLDPFCSMRIGGCRFDTPIVYHSINPYWFTTHSAPIHDLFDEIKIDIYDKDTLKSDYVGSVGFALKDVVNDFKFNGVDKWLPISRSKTGNIHFRITYFALTNDLNRSTYSYITSQVKKSQVKFPLGLFLLYIYDLTLNETFFTEKLTPLIQIRFNGCTYQSLPIDRKKGLRKFFVEECYQFATSNPAQDVIEFVVLDISGFNLAKLVSIDVLSKKIIGHSAISLKTILNKTIHLKEKETANLKVDESTQDNYLSSEGGFIQKIKLYTSHNDKKSRRSVGYMKAFVCLSLCKLDQKVYDNLQQHLHIKTNPDQLTSNTSFLKRILKQPTSSIISPLRTLNSIKLPTFTDSHLNDVNVAVLDDLSVLPVDLDQDSCYVKLRFFWPERKRIFIEVLRIINLPKKYILKHLKYSVSISLSYSFGANDSDSGSNSSTLNKPNKSKKLNKLERLKKGSNESNKIKPLESSYLVKRTSKLKYNFNLNAIVFNQRLSFDLNPQLHIEDYLMSIRLNAHSLSFCSNFADLISVKETKLPSIIFRCDLIERYIQFDKDNKV